MDFRKPLFHLEQLSPKLARKIWQLTPLLNAPLILAMGFQIKVLTDLSVKVLVPCGRQNRNERGEIQAAVLVAAAEFSSRLLWQRHLSPTLEELALSSIQCEFFRPATTTAFAKVELSEIDREEILRKLRSGEVVSHESSVVLLDEKEIKLATLNCQWRLRPLRPLALGSRGIS